MLLFFLNERRCLFFPEVSLEATADVNYKSLLADDGIPDDEASGLNVSIPGARKGRNGVKCRRAPRIQPAKDDAPMKVEILEVGEKGMEGEELAFNWLPVKVMFSVIYTQRELNLMGCLVHHDRGKITLLLNLLL
ncbi:unnamed protein product [Linum trigynum]|uniref:Uncharacterized protein n=1 Tax=Linum trigynum TaxID=586398 RepID=A0AAV2E2H1_9ROSI